MPWAVPAATPEHELAIRADDIPSPEGLSDTMTTPDIRTFLFTDIEGSTRRWEQHTAAMPAALERHDVLLRDAIEAHGGRVFKTVGDAFCAAFASASDALGAALASQRAIQAEDWSAFGVDFPPIRVRMGLHSGTAQERDGDYFGPPVNRAARIEAAGHGGQVLLSEATMELVGGRLPSAASLLDLGEHRLKDLTRPERLFQLLAPGLATDLPPIDTLERHRTNLPVQPTSFIGRDEDLRAVWRRLNEAPMVTLSGVGGTGKTRLAIQVAAENLEAYPDGAWFVNLAPVTDPQLVIQTTVAALDLREQAGRPLIDTLLEHVKKRNLLVILDNCEHLVDAVAQLAHRLLASAPRVRILATSREALGVPGEAVLQIAPLPTPAPSDADAAAVDVERLMRFAAVRLFEERAQAVRADFAVTAVNAPHVAAICRRLDGIPLALELAAARVRHLSPDQIAARLDQRFRLLTSGGRTVLPRQQTLQAAIDWSHDLLDPLEQVLFRRLAVFRGGWTLEAAEHVCEGPMIDGGDGIDGVDVVDVVSRLVDKSLVNVGDAADGAARYVFLETIRVYALAHLDASGEAFGLTERYMHWFIDLARTAEPNLVGREQARWLLQLDAERDNYRAVLEAALERPERPELSFRLARSYWRYWSARSMYVEASGWLTRIMALPVTSGLDADRAFAIYIAGNMDVWLRRVLDAEAKLREAMGLACSCGDERLEAWCLNELGRVSLLGQDMMRAAAFFEASLAIKQRIGPVWDTAIGLNTLANALQASDAERADSLHREALAIATGPHGNPRIRYQATQGLADLALRRGDLAVAQRDYSAALELALEIGHPLFLAITILSFAWLAQLQGRSDRAARLMGAARAIQREAGMEPGPCGTAVPPGYLADLHGPILDRVRADMGEEAFCSSVGAGNHLSPDEAVALIQEG